MNITTPVPTTGPEPTSLLFNYQATKKTCKKNCIPTYVTVILVSLIVNLFFSSHLYAQNAGDYRSVASSNWNTLTTWQRYSGTAWVTPTSVQGTPTSTSGVVTIQSPNIVVVTAAVTVDEVTIATGGKLTVNNVTLTIANGTGTDLNVNGTLEMTGSTGAITTTGTVAVNSGGTYIHNRDGGAIPIATWSPTSNCNIIGVTANVPTVANFAQTFGNMTWNSTSQTTDASLIGNLIAVGGNLTIASTGTGSLRLSNSGLTATFDLAGNFSQSGGTFYIAGTGGSNTWTANINGDFSITGGTFNLNGGGGTTTVNIKANFSATAGTVTEAGSASNYFIFNGGVVQTYTSGASVTNSVNFTVNAGTTLQMASASTIVAGGGTFTLSNGATLGITSSNGIVATGTNSGNIQTTGRTFNTGANYTYNGTTAQVTGTGIPTNITGSLTIDNIGNTVTLSAARTMANAGIINLTNGIFATGSNLTMASTSSITSAAGSMTGTLQGAGIYNVNYIGNSKTTGPELGGSGLNNLVENLSAGQTLTLGTVVALDGALSIASGNSLDVSASNFGLTIGGSYTNNGTFIARSGTVTFSGAAQTIGGTGSLAFNTLALSGSGNKTFSAATTVAAGLSISGTAVMLLPNSTSSSAATLAIAGNGQASGSWGSSTSSATFKSATYFGSTTTGIINITTSGCTAGQWTGVTSTDWFNASNWCSGVPTASSDVVIPSGTPNQPSINAVGAVCRNITINAGATLTIAASNAITVNGDWTNNGTFTANTSTVTFSGSTTQLITGSATTNFSNLTINKTAAANSTTSQSKAFVVGGNLTVTQGNMVLQATDASYLVSGNLVVSANGTFTHSVDWDATGKQLTVAGNVDITGTYAYTVRSHLQMTGTGKTIRTGVGPASALSILTLSGATVTANGPVTVNDNFWAMFNTTGSFSTGGQTVIANAGLLNSGGTVNVNGGSLTVTNNITVGGPAGNNGTINISAGAVITDGIILGDVAATAANSIVQTGGTLTVNGPVTINQPAAAVTNTWNIGAQAATVSGLISFASSSTTTTRIAKIIITSGTLNANGGISFSGTTTATKVIDMSTGTGTGTLNLKGALTSANAATLTAGTLGSNFNYNDNVTAQTVGFFGAGAYNNLNINTTGGVGATLAAAITTTNVTGNLRVQSGTLNNAGLTIAGNASKILQVADGAFLNLAGTTSAFPTGFGTNTLGAGSTVTYSGSGNQTIAAQNYGNLVTTLNGTRTITLINAGTIGIAGSFTPAAGTTSYTVANNTTIFNGTGGSQNIPAFNFNNLTINNTAGVSLTGNVNVNGSTLAFTNGKISTGSSTITLASGATVTGAGAGKYVNGKLGLTFPTGTPSRTFDIGDGSNYTPVAIAFTTPITSGGILIGSTTAGDNGNIGTSNLIASKSVNRFWTLTNGAGTIAPIGFNATFNFIGPVGSGDIDAGVNTSNLYVQRYNGSTWSSAVAGIRTTTSTQTTAVDGFGDFQVAEINCVTPVINAPAITNVSCNGNTTGAIAITTTGGTTPLTYLWSNGATTQNISSLAAGNYSVVITATGGCTVSSGTIAVTQPAILNAVVSSTNVSCNGSSDGSITFSSPTGGAGTYEYSINGGTNWQASGNFSGLTPSTRNIRIRDAVNTSCFIILNSALTISQPAVLNAVVASNNVSCNGSSDGGITITSPTGGYGTYEYSINGGTNWQASGTFANLAPNTYNVQVRDAAHTSCVVILNAALTISQPAVLNAVVSSTNVSCNGSSDGSITITSPTGGYGTYEYTINGGTNWQASGTFTSLAPNTYNVQVRDAAHTSCVIILNAALTISQPAVLNAVVASNNVSCNGSSDGSITITSPTGGYGTYEYTINGGTNWQASGTFTNLASNTYNVQVRDVAHTSCVVILNAALTISQPVVMNAIIASGNVSCNGSSDGSISITSPTGGYGTYEYSINGGTNWQASGTFTNLASNTYNVQVRDAAHTSCVVILNAALTISQPAVQNAIVASGNVSCNGSSDGSITITSPTGGYGTYEYTINGGTNWQASGTFTSLAPNTYNVQVRDAAHTSCVIILNSGVVVTEPVVLGAVVNSTNGTCAGNDGSIIISSATGGSNTYEYSINGGINWQSSGSFTGLSAATYNVQVRDAASPACVVILNTSLVISSQSAIAAPTSGGNQSVCFNGDNEQTITATATGGAITWYDAATGGNVVAPPVLTGVGTVTYYAEASNGACISTTRTAVSLTILSAPANPVSGGDETVCYNGNPSQTLIATASSPVAITWYDAASAGSIVTPALSGVGSATFYASASDGTCPSPGRTAVTLTINPLLAAAGPITGPLDVCPLIGSPTATTYSIAAVPGASSYTWVVPVGTTIVSGQGTNSIGVTFTNSFALTNSQFSVTAEAPGACTGAASFLEVSKIVPEIPTVISGPTDACPFIGSTTNAVYSIDPVIHATSYTWTVAGAATIVSGQGTTSIQVSYLGGFTTGSVKVVANSNCGSRGPRSLGVTKLTPTSPATINGPVNACPYIGTNTVVNYSVDLVDNAVSYLWTIPANMTLVSGQGTSTIGVTFNNGYTTSLVKVRSVSNCSSSGDRTLSVVASTTSTPGIISGPVNACAFIGTADQATYSIRQVAGATSYNWSVPTGVVVNSHPGGVGINDTAILVSFNAAFVSGSTISVQAVACLASASRTLAITRSQTAMPGIISGATNPCPYMVSSANPAGTPVLYSIRKVANATSYSWGAPSGGTITAHPAGAGINDTTIEITYSAAFVSGSVTVSAMNDCGAGAQRTLSVARLVPSAPAVPTIVNTVSCPNRQYTYSVASLPANASGITWVVPAQATLVSGQGSTSITVSYPAGVVSGTITATAFNNCSNSSVRTINVSLPACVGGRAINTPAIATMIAPAELRISLFPNPAISDVKLQVFTTGKEDVKVTVMDLEGRVLKTMSVKPYLVANIGAGLKSGSYLVEVTQGKQKTTQKLVKL